MSSILVKQLYLFPIKSLAVIAVDQVLVDAAGFVGDRRFMLVDPQGKFITQRTRPDLTRFNLSLVEGGYLVQDHISGQSKVLSSKPDLKESMAAELWDDSLQVVEVGEGWSEWFSDLLQEPARLVMQKPESPRIIKEKYQGKLNFAYSGGMWQADPGTIVYLQLCDLEEVVLQDLYENPVKVNVHGLLTEMRQRWQEQMNAWNIEYEALSKNR